MPSSYIDDQVQESTSDRREQWMLDSGTTFHIIGHDEAQARGYPIVALPKPISFSTANGQAWAREVADITVPGALEPLNAFVLPIVLALLIVCMPVDDPRRIRMGMSTREKTTSHKTGWWCY